ncbi:hypothetical protein [Natrialba sp. SSL1]|uniref:hypothetical protein n=1 Tax=Natrialba sp. SSL1 TaxID=1869245 RepID=UPI0008F87F1C|nr:hypothetical protein [Natrialba sp. SSL1]OIB58171.1 hypothetical protein BBD46_01930 [Natrialba sp. SSL1]
MSSDQRRDDLLSALALTELSVHYEEVDSDLSRRAWQLAADRLVEHDVEPRGVVDELGIGECTPRND